MSPDINDLIRGLNPDQIAALIDQLPPAAVLSLAGEGRPAGEIPAGPAEQALQLDPTFRIRPHVQYLSDRLAQAVRDLEAGRNRMLAVSMPPRAGKSTLLSMYGPLWMLRKHPEWKFILASYDASLSGGWASQTRQMIEEHPDLGITLAKDGGAGSTWRTTSKGSMFATSVRGGMTGRGGTVVLVDDPTKDFVEAHSALIRQSIWDWWLSTVQTRLEPPFLVIAVATRWHESDMLGRLLSKDYEGDPSDWEKISLPAIAEADDVLGRERGEPLLSPLIDETPDEALTRWADVKRSVGSYVWAAMYQQHPSPSKGAIFDTSWWRYWTTDPGKATDDGRIRYLDPSTLLGARWLDSWDCSFKETTDSDFVVGQRWCRHGANRYLIAQQRGRWSFTKTIDRMVTWARGDDPGLSPCGNLVHTRLIEDKANGPAIIDTLHDRVSGLKPINPKTSKEARARAVTPECESGNVYLPHPSDPGNEWVTDFLSEMREFPHSGADDQVDALTQALTELRNTQSGSITVPGHGRVSTPRNVTRTQSTILRRG